MVFIETSGFTKRVYTYLNEDEYIAFQYYLQENPSRGDLIAGSGGLRKIRWAQAGRGKRGGVRIIYYYKNRDNEIWLLTIYAKNEIATLSQEAIRMIAKELGNE